MILVFGKTGQVATELRAFKDIKALGREHVDLANAKACRDAIIFYNNTLHASKPHSDSTRREALSVRLLLDGSSMTKDYINATPPFDRMGVKVVEDGVIPERFPKLW